MDKVSSGNLFELLPKDLSNEEFLDIVKSDNVTIQRIVSKGHTAPETGWFDQVANEFVIVLQGEAKVAFEDDTEICLTAGSHLNIPAHKKHKVIWTTPDTETIWLAIHYT